MKFKNLLIVSAVLFLAFGIGFVLIPSTLISLYGIIPEPGMILTSQLYGGLLIAIGLFSWSARGLADAAALRAIQLSFMIAFAINTIVVIQATVSGVMNALGWSAVVIYLFLTVGFAYFYFTTPKGQEE